MKSFRLYVFLFLLAGACGTSRALEVYHIGNSYTLAINPPGIADWVSSRGGSYEYGYHAANGANLRRLWQFPTTYDFIREPYGTYSNALPNYEWDILTLEPFDIWIDATSEEIMIKNFVDLLRSNPDNSATQLMIYESWPFRSRIGESTFSDFWNQPWTGEGLSTTVQTRDYFRRLVAALNDTDLGLEKDVLLVPVGDVLDALDQRMRAGDVPGFSSVFDLYNDELHLKSGVGYFTVSTVFYATMFGDNPMGLAIPASMTANVTPELAAIIQRVAWDVVAGHPDTGVASEVVADFNGDSNVDLLDYQLWKTTFGSRVDLRADANLDFVVDAADFTVWRDGFLSIGSDENQGIMPVPAPSSLWLAATAGVVVWGHSRIRHYQ